MTTYRFTMGAHTWTVDATERTSDRLQTLGRYGETEADKLTIYLDAELNATLWNDTLLHELVHAAAATSGLTHRLPDNLEEDIASSIAPYLAQALEALIAGGLR